MLLSVVLGKRKDRFYERSGKNGVKKWPIHKTDRDRQTGREREREEEGERGRERERERGGGE